MTDNKYHNNPARELIPALLSARESMCPGIAPIPPMRAASMHSVLNEVLRSGLDVHVVVTRNLNSAQGSLIVEGETDKIGEALARLTKAL